MKTIEERRILTRRFYILGANDQKKLTLEAFDEWLCRNSWITRDEGNRKPPEDGKKRRSSRRYCLQGKYYRSKKKLYEALHQIECNI